MQVIADVFPFIASGLLAGWLSRGVRLHWILIVSAVIFAVVGCLLLLGMPFAGLLTEAPLALAASVALVPTMLIVLASFRSAGKAIWSHMMLPFLLLLLLVMVMMPWTVRVHYARRVAWVCDGTIISKYRSSNHNAPALEIQTPSGPVILDGVDESMWTDATVGDHLIKSRGTINGELNGRTVRVVPRVMPWWNEPK